MLLNQSNNVEYEKCPPCNAPSRIYMVIDIGTQETEFEGVKHMRRQVRINWELPTKLMADGRPFARSVRYHAR